MTTTTSRWLLVVLAIVALAIAAPLVSAHGEDSTADDPRPYGPDAPPANATAEEWAVWMETRMTDHMGPDGVAWMEAHTGVTLEEMAEAMANGTYPPHAYDGPRGDGVRPRGPGYGPHGDAFGPHGPGYGPHGDGFGPQGTDRGHGMGGWGRGC